MGGERYRVLFEQLGDLGFERGRGITSITNRFNMAKVFFNIALEGYRRVLGEEHKSTLGTLNNMGAVLQNIEDYAGSLDYFQEALRVQEKVLGKTHPDTLDTIMNMANSYEDVFKDFEKSEEMKRLALHGYKTSLGKDINRRQ